MLLKTQVLNYAGPDRSPENTQVSFRRRPRIDSDTKTDVVATLEATPGKM